MEDYILETWRQSRRVITLPTLLWNNTFWLVKAFYHPIAMLCFSLLACSPIKFFFTNMKAVRLMGVSSKDVHMINSSTFGQRIWRSHAIDSNTERDPVTSIQSFLEKIKLNKKGQTQLKSVLIKLNFKIAKLSEFAPTTPMIRVRILLKL